MAARDFGRSRGVSSGKAFSIDVCLGLETLGVIVGDFRGLGG